MTELSLSDGGKNAPKLRNGWYNDGGGQRIVQPMQREDGVQKGVRTILQERGLWPAGMTLKVVRQLLAEQIPAALLPACPCRSSVATPSDMIAPWMHTAPRIRREH